MDVEHHVAGDIAECAIRMGATVVEEVVHGCDGVGCCVAGGKCNVVEGMGDGGIDGAAVIKEFAKNLLEEAR